MWQEESGKNVDKNEGNPDQFARILKFAMINELLAIFKILFKRLIVKAFK